MALDKPLTHSAESTRNGDKLLYTPGPLTTSRTVKEAMQRDLGSRDHEFMQVVRGIRARLLTLAGQSDDSPYTTILMQGSGTFGIEAVIASTISERGKLLIVINGAYGKRMAQIARMHKIEAIKLIYPENTTPDPAEIEKALAADPAIEMVAVVHCETTTGILNPIEAIGGLAKRYAKAYFVDAMSSFGAVPVDIANCNIDYLVSSSNKCIEGVPGFSFVIARKQALAATDGNARVLSLDLLAQWRELEKSGQFRFTPPIQSMLAFHEALLELEAEGGVTGRAARYAANHDVLVEGMRSLGFQEYLEPAQQSYIITTFCYPMHPNFSFEAFYGRLGDKGFVIYPGKLGEEDCFRIGSIGRLYPEDMTSLLAAIREVLQEMDVTL